MRRAAEDPNEQDDDDDGAKFYLREFNKTENEILSI